MEQQTISELLIALLGGFSAAGLFLLGLRLFTTGRLVTGAALMAGAMLWAAVPAVLKVKTGAHEVVTTIMMNGIAVSIVAYALNGPLKFTDAPPGQNVALA